MHNNMTFTTQKYKLVFNAQVILMLFTNSINICCCCSDDDSLNNKINKYILYDVNIGEGFNLKRDVYMRMSIFMNSFSKKSNENWYMVLPPWNKQWHWTNEKIHISYLWFNFFDVKSLQLYAPVIEIDQFYRDYGDRVDEVHIMQHFPDFYEWSDGNSNIDWSDRWSFADCRDYPYLKTEDGTFLFYHGKKKVKATVVRCISFQGSSKFLESVVLSSNASAIMFDRAEIVTHDKYGDENYWMCRRSMRFAKHLVKAANSFRALHLNSSDEEDGTVRPADWRDEFPHRSAKGGPYLSVHLRRHDFLQARPNEVPSVADSVIQIHKYLAMLNLKVVFIATDMADEEYYQLDESLSRYGFKCFKYMPSRDKVKFSDGELAIIDQIIASHARFFIGTHESTFSFRIQEEREVMGFPPKTTFNRLCHSSVKKCSQPTKWLIKFPSKGSSSPNIITEIKLPRHLNSDEL